MPGGTLEPGATLDMGHWDEMCLGPDDATLTVSLVRPGDQKYSLETQAKVRARDVTSRWVPEAFAVGDSCVCRGSEVGPGRLHVRDRLDGALLLDLPDGGLKRVRYGTIIIYD